MRKAEGRGAAPWPWGQKSRMSAGRGHTTTHTYNNRIPTPALPGSGSRDRTALRLISAGVRQRPLDCKRSIAPGRGFVKSGAADFAENNSRHAARRGLFAPFFVKKKPGFSKIVFLTCRRIDKRRQFRVQLFQQPVFSLRYAAGPRGGFQYGRRTRKRACYAAFRPHGTAKKVSTISAMPGPSCRYWKAWEEPL